MDKMKEVMRGIYLLFALLSISINIQAQNKVSRNLVTSKYNSRALKTLSLELKQSNRSDSVRIKQFIKATGKKEFIRRNQRIAQLRKVTKSGVPLYYITHNIDAANSTNTSTLWNNPTLGVNLQGQGMTLGEWDGDAIRSTHIEFNGRVTTGDGKNFAVANESTRHATHVAGTMIASGINNQVRGMAPQANLIGHDWNNDDAEMAAFATQGYLLSNHSYGIDATELPEWYFGYYDDFAATWDQIANNAPYYLIVSAAGNDRGYNPDVDGQVNPSKQGYDLMTGTSNAKNILLVGSVNDINSDEIQVSSFSSWGPTDDGRIKPDICGNGWQVRSTSSLTNQAYETNSGTSMATPNVTGSLLLLQQLYHQQYGEYMKAATLKGLAIHTATDVLPNEGPDYQSGWGVLNTQKAAELMLSPGNNIAIQEHTLNNQEELTLNITADGTTPLVATICWNDPAATPGSEGIVDDSTIKLINDLDIRINQSTSTHYPWILDPSSRTSPASKGDNIRDNVEQVFIAEAEGNYTISISNKGDLQNGSQDFSIIISGFSLEPCDLATQPNGIEVSNIHPSDAAVSWEFENATLTYDIRYRAIENSTWTTINGISNTAYLLDDLSPGTGYVLQMRSNCQETNSVYSDEIFFSTPNCLTPSSIMLGDVTSQSIALSWFALADALSYSVEYKTQDETEWQSILTNETVITLAELESGTSYDIRLRSNCSTEHSSDWVTETVITECLPVLNITALRITQREIAIQWNEIKGIERYDLRYRQTDSDVWTTTSYSENQALIDNLNPGTQYEIQLKSVCTNGTELNYSAILQFTTYCEALAEDSSNEWIERVIFGLINNTSGNNNGYADFTDQSAHIIPGNTTKIGLQSGQLSDFPKYWKVWIDFNRNGNLNDPGEEVLSGFSAQQAMYEQNISIPSNATLGTTLMRVAMQYNEAPSSCGNAPQGEVEDYSIVIGTQQDESSFSADKQLSMSATLSEMDIYPVPTNTFLNINIGNSIEGAGTIRIVDINGKVLMSRNITQRLSLDVSQLSAGIYFVVFDNTTTSLKQRFVKQ
ncbi:T9SS type A sorting domain-containing protein [Puteibacter caeruleilacunae]|nr:T9SS type A sorting domain-containing protein [Puteibacter caeruleilacunae]